MINNKLLLFILLFITACSEPITINGFDKATWIADKDGCKNNRKTLAELLESNKEKLLGKDQQQITSILGKPDQHEIYRRSQRFYIYLIGPGSSCDDFNKLKPPSTFTIRFNAMGKAHEIMYYR